jgi:hypothetical protein
MAHDASQAGPPDGGLYYFSRRFEPGGKRGQDAGPGVGDLAALPRINERVVFADWQSQRPFI